MIKLIITYLLVSAVVAVASVSVMMLGAITADESTSKRKAWCCLVAGWLFLMVVFTFGHLLGGLGL